MNCNEYSLFKEWYLLTYLEERIEEPKSPLIYAHLSEYRLWVSTRAASPVRLDAGVNTKEGIMTCRRCQGCMARDHFLDLQESGGEWWLQGWRCINCGHVFDPVLEKNRQLHAAAMASAEAQQSVTSEPIAVHGQEDSLDVAA